MQDANILHGVKIIMPQHTGSHAQNSQGDFAVDIIYYM